MKAVIDFIKCIHRWANFGRERQCTKCGLNEFDD